MGQTKGFGSQRRDDQSDGRRMTDRLFAQRAASDAIVQPAGKPDGRDRRDLPLSEQHISIFVRRIKSKQAQS